jgi:hypothetical protein
LEIIARLECLWIGPPAIAWWYLIPIADLRGQAQRNDECGMMNDGYFRLPIAACRLPLAD